MPLVLSLLLILLGAVILVAALRVEGEPVGKHRLARHLFITARADHLRPDGARLGFVGAVFITALFACFASFKMKPLYALALSVLLTVFSDLVFSYGLGLPFERFGPWLRCRGSRWNSSTIWRSASPPLRPSPISASA